MPARVRVLEMTQPTHDSNTLIHMGYATFMPIIIPILGTEIPGLGIQCWRTFRARSARRHGWLAAMR